MTGDRDDLPTLEVLLELTSGLAAATTEEAVARAFTSGLTALGASSAAVWVVDGDHLRLAAPSPVPSALPLSVDGPLPRCVHDGDVVLLASRADYRARFPASSERGEDGVSSTDTTFVTVPLRDVGAA
ncbi:MAG TPA: hypothetical protein VK427_05325, partial [Kofleriaceae bacterium]|nr:hypothetical protein [Kofleriaceae bacterium]